VTGDEVGGVAGVVFVFRADVKWLDNLGVGAVVRQVTQRGPGAVARVAPEAFAFRATRVGGFGERHRRVQGPDGGAKGQGVAPVPIAIAADNLCFRAAKGVR
jgi:hypothetical protein